MKPKLFLGLLAAAAVSFTACQKDQTLSEVTEDNTAIGFGTYVGRNPQTKATVTNIGKMKENTYQGFGVFAYYTGAASYTTGQTTFAPAFMTNQRVYYKDWGSGEAWGYEPQKYWPGTTDANKTSFFAYAPFITIGLPVPEKGITSLPTESTTGDPILSFTDPGDVSSQFDLLYADPIKDDYNGKASNNGFVKFNFNHALSKIGFKVKTKNTVFKATIISITLDGSFNTKGTLNLNTGEWNATSTPNTIYTLNSTNSNFNANATDLSSTTEKSIIDDGNFLMILPTDLTSAGFEITVQYSYQYKVSEGVWAPAVSTSNSGTVNIKLEKGKAYTFILTLDPATLTPIKFAEPYVTDWKPLNESTDPDTEDFDVSM